MSELVFLDTSYVLALVNTKDEFHSVAETLADEILSPVVTTEAILVEIGNALAKVQWRSLAIGTIEDLIDDPDIEIVSVSCELFSKAFRMYKDRMDKEWGLTDCISFVIMQERKMTKALTTDHHFEQAGFIALMKRKLNKQNY